MIQITEKKSCAGCTACAAVCPKGAISMVADEWGLSYPEVDTEKCVDCGLCDKICPFDKETHGTEERIAYALKHNDPSVLEKSTSGGIFTAVSDYVLSAGGVVYGAAIDDNIVVRHTRATTPDERDRMRGSKYVQSELGDTLVSVKRDLAAGKKVLFVGTPCQVAGLKSYLGNKCDGLITLDLICHGVPSPLIYKEHIGFLSKKLNTKIIDYKFRPKKWGWHVHREIACGEKREYHSTPYTDLWRYLYYSRIATRPSCNNCPYSNLSRVGDITIGDCRGIDRVLPDFKSDEGVTLAIVNTDVGKAVFEAISDTVTAVALNVSDVMQPPLRQSSKPNPESERFFEIYKTKGYKAAISEYYGPTYVLKYYIKKMLRRI